MKTTICAIALTAAMTLPAAAQVSSVQVRNGDVYLQLPQGFARLTKDGKVSEAVKSRDGSLVAYLHTDHGNGEDAMLSISLCVVAQKSCRVIVQPQPSAEPEQNLTNINGIKFSYQAHANPDGSLVGSIFFEADAWATSGAIHRVSLNDGAIKYIAAGNGFSIVSNGRFTGAIDFEQTKIIEGTGRCGADTILDPNTGRILQQGPFNDC